jgi:hypothetical protein
VSHVQATAPNLDPQADIYTRRPGWFSFATFPIRIRSEARDFFFLRIFLLPLPPPEAELNSRSPTPSRFPTSQLHFLFFFSFFVAL